VSPSEYWALTAEERAAIIRVANERKR